MWRGLHLVTGPAFCGGACILCLGLHIVAGALFLWGVRKILPGALIQSCGCRGALRVRQWRLKIFDTENVDNRNTR